MKNRKQVRTISVFPTHTKNKYIPIILECLKNAGYTIVPIEDSSKRIKEIDAFIFNWYETLPENHTFYHFVKRYFRILYLLLKGKEINCTIHNKQPHEGRTFYSDCLIKLLLKVSSHVFILCSETMDVLKAYIDEDLIADKVVKLPHPSYTGAYGCATDAYPEYDGVLRCLYFGHIKPYKNVDLMIQCFIDLIKKGYRLELSVCGNCPDESFRSYLQKMISTTDGIKLDIRYVPDEEIIKMVSGYDLFVLPYSLKSSLNSGAVILAFSYKRTVVSPLIGTLKDLPYERISYCYSYDGSDSDHLTSLKCAVEKAYLDFQNQHNSLKEKGILAYEVVNSLNSQEKITEIFKNIWSI